MAGFELGGVISYSNQARERGILHANPKLVPLPSFELSSTEQRGRSAATHFPFLLPATSECSSLLFEFRSSAQNAP
jgi:hypothetical protein